MYRIPFNRPYFTGSEQRYIAEAMANEQTLGNGLFTQKCQAFLEQQLSVPKVLLTTSCTHALEMIALLLNIQPGDEIIVPSFTFPSTANAFVMRGAHPAFIDIRPDTLNMDETKLEQLITPRTKAIVTMHYAGVGCEMDLIKEIAERNRLSVVEDNAHGLFGKYKQKHLGTLGCLTGISFHETKNFTCGEGGALIINDPCFINRAEVIRDKGTNRSSFLRGQVDKYTWVDLGSSYLPSDLLAAFLYAQLEAKEQIQSIRRRIWEFYYDHLQNLARDQDIQLPVVLEHCEQSYHTFYLLLPTSQERGAMIDHLRANGIHSAFHYLPLHLSKMGQGFGAKQGDCPVAEDVSKRLLRLPFHNMLTESAQKQVVAAIYEFYKR